MTRNQRPIRVLYLINGLGTGGAERSLTEMLPRLERSGIDVSICGIQRKAEGVGESAESSGHSVRYLNSRGHFGHVRELRALLAAVKPDVLHTTIIEANIVGRLAAAGTGVPVLTSLVNTSYAPERFSDPNVNARKLRLWQAVDGWTGRNLTTHFHAITEAVEAASVRDLGLNPDKISVIRRGRDPERVGVPSPERRAEMRRRFEIPPEAPVLINVGRQEYQKGQGTLLEAFDAIAEQMPEAVLLIAGRKGAATADLERRVAASDRLQRQVRFLGHREDVPDLMATADVFVFPSLYEGLGGAVIEAMALGLPVVASGVPAVREVVEEGKNADFVPVEDSGALANAVLGLLRDDERRKRYSAHSRERYLQHFQIDAVVDQMAELYRTLASQS